MKLAAGAYENKMYIIGGLSKVTSNFTRASVRADYGYGWYVSHLIQFKHTLKYFFGEK